MLPKLRIGKGKELSGKNHHGYNVPYNTD